MVRADASPEQMIGALWTCRLRAGILDRLVHRNMIHAAPSREAHRSPINAPPGSSVGAPCQGGNRARHIVRRGADFASWRLKHFRVLFPMDGMPIP
jgi:hypothetical protein